jgi:type IV secretory pathway VirB4 component
MFNREKPLPIAVLASQTQAITPHIFDRGIDLGNGAHWNPEALPNAHIVTIGASGSGKTQTLKAIAYELRRTYPQVQVILIDFHGDQALISEQCYPMHMASPHGINPLVINLDPEGGGPNLQAIIVAALLKKAIQLGPNQEGLLLEVLADCYQRRGIDQADQQTWQQCPPHFGDVQTHLQKREDEGCKDSAKLRLKLGATFQYGIFSRQQPDLNAPLIRIDLSKLPPALQGVGAESLAHQLLNHHRLLGEIEGRLPRTVVFIDEAKEMPRMSGNACDRIIADGRKYGLALVLASQSERHLSLDIIGNSATKIVLPVDQTEVRKVARKFRFAENRIAQLQSLQALCRFGTQAELVQVHPYYKRVEVR